MAKQNNTKVVTGIVRLSYANIWDPKAPVSGGDPRYSCSLIIPKSDTETVDAINRAIDCAIQEGIGKFGGREGVVGTVAGEYRQSGVGHARDADGGLLGQDAQMLAHLGRSGGTVQADEIDPQRLQRRQGRTDLGAEQHGAGADPGGPGGRPRAQ